ncbi:MAG: 23S rRNA (guanosine(2251)-2'-O)-methyltransferase RlmB [Desulfobacterales bacterium]|nr:23S rRNA (guanosine(2251)-2'-O)-methyltransferase RlmB [Desulfobacterales bacterium]
MTKPDKKTETLCGIHSVTEAFRAGKRKIVEVFTVRDNPSKRLQYLISQAEKNRVPVSVVDSEKMEKLAKTSHHQDIAARVSSFQFASLTDVINASDGSGNRRVLLLDGIVDPHNLGAIIRTAVCAGVDGIILPKDRSSSPTPTVSRISAGALEHVLMAQITNMAGAIKVLKDEGFWVTGLDAFASRSLYDIDMTGPVALVIGGEEKGIRPLVKKSCDYIAAIPHSGIIDSMNASVAGAIAIYEVVRQQKKES